MPNKIVGLFAIGLVVWQMYKSMGAILCPPPLNQRFHRTSQQLRYLHQ